MTSVLLNHKSIRKFKQDAIDEEIIQSILNAGIRASNTGNMQVYSIVISRDIDMKKKLWEVHFKQNMILQAPVLLTFCADFNRFNKWCNQRKADPGYDNFLSFFTAATDALLVAQNVAEYNGLGICYLGTAIYNADKIIDILKLPHGVVPVTALAIGYPDENPELTDRLPLKAVVHDEIYKAISKVDDPIEKLKTYVVVRMRTFHATVNFYEAIKNEYLANLDFINKIREKYDKEEKYYKMNFYLSSGMKLYKTA